MRSKRRDGVRRVRVRCVGVRGGMSAGGRVSQHVRDVSILRLRPEAPRFRPLSVEGVGHIQEEVCREADFAVQEHPRAPGHPGGAGRGIVDRVHLRQVQETVWSSESPLRQHR